MEKHAKLCFCRRWEQLRLKGRAKHPFKVHIWASISKRGVTRVLIFSGNMDSTFYVGDILEKTLLPFIQSHFPDGHCFQQDNDLKHTNRLAQEFMACHGIKLWKLPPPPRESRPESHRVNLARARALPLHHCQTYHQGRAARRDFTVLARKNES